jgi:hypothetical protein
VKIPPALNILQIFHNVDDFQFSHVLFFRVGQHLKAAGQAVDIDFTGKCDRRPNTALAHVLMDFTLKKYGEDKQNDVAERLFKVKEEESTQVFLCVPDLSRQHNQHTSFQN